MHASRVLLVFSCNKNFATLCSSIALARYG